jgi:DinB superfamily
MDIGPLLIELYDRIPPLVLEAVEGLDPGQLTWRPGPDANSIGWLAWHIGRVQDAQISAITGEAQMWVGGTWARQMGLDPDPRDVGYGHTSVQVASVKPESPGVLVEYLDAVQSATVAFLGTLAAEELDRIVDRRRDPPVTLGVRLVSIADDCLQHVGQAAYVRGLLGV